MSDEESRQRFFSEAKTLFSLKHEAIVPVYDFGKDGDQLYFVMPHMRGGSLGARLRKKGPLSLDETSKILTRLATALDKVHQKGFIHRDIKPDNVLFDEQGRSYLSDFGIARVVGTGKRVTFAGTLAYMAPEQMQACHLTGALMSTNWVLRSLRCSPSSCLRQILALLYKSTTPICLPIVIK